MRLYSLLALPLLLALWATAYPPVMADPIAEFEPTSFDFGKPLEGEKVKAVFQVKNIGDADLEIVSVHAGCGCTEAKVTESKILPGKAASVEAVFNTTGYRSQVSKTVTVTTNDPAHQRVVLTIKGEVVPIAELKPQSYLNLGDLKLGTISLSDITLVPKVEQPFRILRVESTGKQASALQYDKKKNRAGNYALKIRVIAGNAPARFYEQLSIVTDLPGNPAIKFPIYGNIVSDTATQGDKTQ